MTFAHVKQQEAQTDAQQASQEKTPADIACDLYFNSPYTTISGFYYGDRIVFYSGFKAGAASRDAEVARLQAAIGDWQFANGEQGWIEALRKERDEWKARTEFSFGVRDQLEKERDQLRDQVTLLRDAVETLSALGILHVHNGQPAWIFPLSVKDRADKAIAATEPK